LFGLSGRTTGLFAGILGLCVVTGALHFADASPVAVFLVAAAALAGLAWVIGIATEAVGTRFGAATTGVLQSTLGNLP
jgi:Ca2+:H+ antiporter